MAVGAILGQRSGIQTINNKLPDENGNVNVTTESIGAMPVGGGEFTGNVSMGTNTLTVAAPVNSSDASTKSYVDNTVKNSVKVVKDISVPSANFYNSNGINNYPWRAAVAISGVTSTMMPEVTFGVDDAISGILAPVCDSYDGGVYIYANSQPTKAVSVASIIIHKQYST